MDVRGEGVEALLVHEFRRHRHGQDRAAVEGAVEDDDARAPGRGARDLDRVLDGLGARVDRMDLVCVSPGHSSSSRRQRST
jgi:hypothetical protein